MTTATQPAKTSLIKVMAAKYGLEAENFKNTIIKTIFPSDKQNPSNEQVAAFLTVANQYNLNPFIKEIYAFPGKGGGIIPIVSIDGWNTLINRHPQYDGVEFKDEFDKDGNLLSITAKIFRKDRSHPTMVTEYMAECRRNTDPWKTHPSRMLRHKTLIQAGRYAFGFSGIYDPDEAERIANANDQEETPVPVAFISEDQRTALVQLAQEFGVVEKLGAIVNAAGFEMLAQITVDKYDDVADAIQGAGKPKDEPEPEVIEAELVDSEDEADERAAIEAEPSISDSPEEKAKSTLADLRTGAVELYRELAGEQKLAAEKFLGTQTILELKQARLREFIETFGQ